MTLSWNWLNEYIDATITIDEASEILTSIGLEVEGVERYESIKCGLENFYIGHVVECERHPNADKLSLTQVNVGDLGVLKIVCGAPNVAKGQKVIVATEGANIHLPSGESFVIKKSKIRGEESNGMICAEDELGIGNSHDGILVLDENAPIGKPAAEHFQINTDYILEIGLTPNRTDAMCHRGVARDLVAAMQARGLSASFVADGKTKFEHSNSKSNKSFKINIQTDLAPKFGGVVLENLENVPSPEWMQNRLKSIGENPKNSIVDTTNYILHDLGQPLHAYDLTKISSEEIIISESADSQKIIGLNGAEYKIESGDILIKDRSNIIGLAGIIGSQDSAVSDVTNSILLEGAYFDSTAIRKTSQRIGLKTEAAAKFEKGIDPNGTEYAINKATLILLSINPKAKQSELNLVTTQEFPNFEIQLTREKLDIYANCTIPDEKVESILTSLGIEIVTNQNKTWTLSIPRYKHDVTREEDVIEEILRIFGYNNLPYPKFLRSNLSFTEGITSSQFEMNMSNLLVGSGYQEIMTNSISQSRFYTEDNPIKLLNSMTSELDCMRSAIIPNILEVVEYNLNRDQKDLHLFEIGNEYFMKNDKYAQRKRLVIVQSGLAESQNWQKPKGVMSDFYSIKSILEKISSQISIGFEYKSTQNMSFNYGLDIICNQKLIGSMGEVKIDKKIFDIKQKVYALDLDFDYIYDQSRKQKVKYTEVSKFPAVKRDLAMVIDEQVEFAQIEKICKKSLGQSLISVGLFDIFKDKSLGENKKSYAIRLTMQNREKTMADKEIDSMIQKLISTLNKEVSAEIRS